MNAHFHPQDLALPPEFFRARRYAIARAWAGGEREVDIALRFSVSRSCVHAVAERWGLGRRKRRFTMSERAAIAAAYIAGEPAASVARRFGCDRSTPRKIAKATGGREP